MRDKQHYQSMLEASKDASIGCSLAASAVYAARFGICEDSYHGTKEYNEINRDLLMRFGDNLTASEVIGEMDRQCCDCQRAMVKNGVRFPNSPTRRRQLWICQGCGRGPSTKVDV